MIDAKVVAEALKKAQPAMHGTFCSVRLMGFAAQDARDKVRQLDYAFQGVRDENGILPHYWD